MAAVIIHYTTHRKIRNFKKLKRQKLPQYRLQKLRNAALLNLKIKNIKIVSKIEDPVQYI